MIEKITGRHKFFIAMMFWSYIVLAVPYTVQGSLAPVTMEFYGINAAQQGFILTMQSVGGLCAALFIALKGEKYNKTNAIAFGLLIICLMTSAIGFAPAYGALLALVAVLGVGVVFIDIMMNGAITDVYPKQKNTVLPLVHAFFSAGAMLTPVFVSVTSSPEDPGSFSRPFRIIGVVAAAVFILYLLSGKRIAAETPYRNMEAMKKRADENPAEIFKTGRAWLFFVIGVLYFTFQFGTTMWLPTYAIRNAGVDFGTAGMMLTAFFAGSLPMRFLGPLFLRRMSPRVLFSVFGWAAAALMTGALFAGNVPLMLLLVAASGFMQGSSVASFILMCNDTFPGRSASASSLFSLAAGTATLTAPVWMGAMSEYLGFLVPMVLICVCMFLSAGMAFVQLRRKP